MNIIKGAILIGLIMIAGCVTPQERNTRAQNRLGAERNKLAQQQEQRNDLGKGFAYAAGISLDIDKNPNVNSEVAGRLLDRSFLAYGNPEPYTAKRMENIATKLTSGDPKTKIEGETLLNAEDALLANYAIKENKIEDNVAKRTQEFENVAAENAVHASKWKKLINTIRWIGIGFVSLIVLKIVGSLLPPPYNAIGFVLDALFGGILGMTKRALPKAMDFGGVVAKESYQVTEKTLQEIVLAIQEAKKKSPEAQRVLREELKDKTDAAITRKKILDVKKDLNLL